MPGPDWTPYVDLTLFDQDAEDIFDGAIEYARNALPEWIPEPGNIEVVILEAVAVESSEVVSAINRVPGAVTETLLKLFGVERSDGSLATTTIQVIAINANGYTIPADTSFAYFPPDGTQPLVFDTDEDLIIPNGSVSGTVDATAQGVGVDYNEPPAGGAVQILKTVPYVRSAFLAASPAGGAAAESDEDFFERAINTLRSYSAALTTADQISSYVLVTYSADVFRAKAFDRSRSADRDRNAPGFIEGAHPGYVLVVVAGENSNPINVDDTQISLSMRETIQEDLSARVNPGLVVEVVNAEIVDVAPSVTVKKQSGFTAVQVEEAVSAALVTYLSSNSWNWDSSVRANELISLIDSAAGVEYVVSIDNIITTSTNASGGAGGDDLELHLIGSLTTPAEATFSITVT